MWAIGRATLNPALSRGIPDQVSQRAGVATPGIVPTGVVHHTLAGTRVKYFVFGSL